MEERKVSDNKYYRLDSLGSLLVLYTHTHVLVSCDVEAVISMQNMRKTYVYSFNELCTNISYYIYLYWIAHNGL